MIQRQSATLPGWSGRRVLVTGAGGFIGSHLVTALVEAGATVRAMVKYNSMSSCGHLDDLDPHLRADLDVRAGDVRDPFFVDEAVRGCDVVFHLAALIGIPYSYVAPASYIDTNVGGTLHVLEASRRHGVGRIVHTSTSEVYGSARYAPMDEEHPLQARSPYSASKIAADKLVESYWRSFNAPVVIVRPFNTFGPRQSLRAVIPSIILQALSSNTIRLGSLSPIRDLTYVTDTVNGFLCAATGSGVEGEIINLGTGIGASVADLVDAVVAIVGDRQLESDAQRVRPEHSEVSKLVSDNSKAKRLIGWRPSLSVQEGLATLIPWYEANLSRFRPSVYTV